MFKFTVLRLLENSFLTPLFPSLHDLTITFSMYKNTPINVPHNEGSPICREKVFLRKGLPY